MAKQPNMKIGIGADTSDFEKGAKTVKQGLSDLSKTGSQALSSLGSAFGVNTGKIGQMTSAIQGLGQKMSECGNTGVSAFGNLLKAIGPVGGAIAGLGLAAAVAGFKQLKAEAENFKSTIDGMNMSMATAAYISTYKQVLHDVNSDTGKQVAEAMDKWERGFARFKAQVGATFTTFMGSDSKWYDAFTPSGVIRAWKQVSANMGAAEDAAEKAAELGNKQAEQMKEQLALDYEIKQIDAEIAALRRDANDKTKSLAEREAARAQYADKVNEKYDKQRDLAVRMAETQEKIDDLASNTFEDTRKTYEMKGKILELDAARENDLKAVDKLESNIAGSASKAAAAAQKQREEIQKMAAVQSKWAGMSSALPGLSGGAAPSFTGVTGPALSILPQRQDVEYFKETFLAQLGEIKVGIGFEADTQKIHDISNEVSSLVQSSVTRTAEIMGSLVGTLAGGGDAWGDFKNAALSAMGDMAIAVGKIAVAAGVATLGIKAAFESLNGYAAIAAGAALIALGAAVKSSLSAVASGDYSAGGGGYSGGSSSSSSGSEYEMRQVSVNVTGTLQADGNQLIAVIQNTNKKNYYTQ